MQLCVTTSNKIQKGENFEINLDDTIKSTAKNAGYLELEYVREKLNDINLIVCLEYFSRRTLFVQFYLCLFS